MLDKGEMTPKAAEMMMGHDNQVNSEDLKANDDP